MASEWQVSSATHRERPLPAELEGWDFFTNLAIRVRLEASLNEARQDCGLDSSCVLNGLVRWRSSRTGLQGASESLPLVQGTNNLLLDLDSSELGGRLSLRVVVTSGKAIDGKNPLAPHRTGVILWEEFRSVVLEGEEERFPVELHDFKGEGLKGPGAAWVLHWDSTDPERSASAAVRLWLNTRHPALEKLIGAELDPVVLSVLKHDVTRQLIERALDTEELADSEWSPGSLGAALIERVKAVFPGMSLDECRAMRRKSPDDYESRLQNASGLLSGD